MTLEQVGNNVVGTGSGSIDLADLTLAHAYNTTSGLIQPDYSVIILGTSGSLDIYSGSIAGPADFGPGSLSSASTGIGELAGISVSSEVIYVPSGYVSDSPLSQSATWDNKTLAGLGVTPGTYTYTFGSGADADSLTLYAGVPVPSAAPEPASLLLLGGGLAALGLGRRPKSRTRPGCSIGDQHQIVPASKINPSEETMRIFGSVA